MSSWPPIVYITAWNELTKCFGERMQQDELDLMDSVLKGVAANMQDEMQRFNEGEILKRFPHLAIGEDNED